MNQMEVFDEVFSAQPIDKNHLYLTVEENVVNNSPKATIENIRRYAANGINLVLTDYHPDRISVEKILETGFKYVIPDEKLYGEESLAKDISMLSRKGIGVLCAGADSAQKIEWIKSTEAVCYIDAVDGVSVNEEIIIRDGLARANAMV